MLLLIKYTLLYGIEMCIRDRAGGDLVVLGLGRDAQLPQLHIQFLHESGDLRTDHAKVVLHLHLVAAVHLDLGQHPELLHQSDVLGGDQGGQRCV